MRLAGGSAGDGRRSAGFGKSASTLDLPAAPAYARATLSTRSPAMMTIPFSTAPMSRLARLAVILMTFALVTPASDAPAQQMPDDRGQCGGLSVEHRRDKFVLYEDGAWTRASVDVVVDFDDAFSAEFRRFTLASAADAVETWNEALCEGLRLQSPVEAPQLAAGELVPDGQIRVSIVTEALNSSSGSRLFGFTVNRAQAGSYISSHVFVDGANWSWTSNNLCSTDPDLTGVLTHELGHALGIDHSQESAAVMRSRAEAEETRWLLTLHDDDVQALAARYGCANNNRRNDPSVSYNFVCEDCSTCDGICAVTSVGPRCLPACMEYGAACGVGTCSLAYDADTEPPVCALVCVPSRDPCSEPVTPDPGCGLAGRSSVPGASVVILAALMLARRRSVSAVGGGV